MIVIDHQAHRVSLSVFGEFTLADYKEFEEVVNFKVQFEGPVDLYFDLSQMADLTIDVAWEEIKFSRAHANDFKRIAVVTDSQWVTWSAWLSQTFVNADVEVFDSADQAKAWRCSGHDRRASVVVVALAGTRKGRIARWWFASLAGSRRSLDSVDAGLAADAVHGQSV
jgi:hypothetical protein